MNLVFSRRLGRSLAALALVGAAIVAPRLANAGTIEFSIADQTAPVTAGAGGFTTSDSTGSFDVVITDSGSDPLSQFQADILLNQGASGITITGATLLTAEAYVFNGNSQEQGNSSPFFDSNEATNSDGTNSGTVTLGSSPLGLMQVSYDIPAGTPVGSYSLTFNQDAYPADANADYVGATNSTEVLPSPGAVANGAIVVNPIPEPSSIVLLVLGAIGMFGFRRLRRQA